MTVTILGAGIAGLSTGYFAKQARTPFHIYESCDRIGGNCITLHDQGFQFDSGAHRFHDRNPFSTSLLNEIMKGDLTRIQAPSQIYSKGKYIDFPLSPLNLIRSLGLTHVFQAGRTFIKARLKLAPNSPNFEEFAVRQYGRTLADLFLLGYSEKLWGDRADRLSPEIAGRRMQGLNLKTFLTETVFSQQKKNQHLDGAFYYPKSGGIGVISDCLADGCGRENISIKSPVTGIHHQRGRIEQLEIGGNTVSDLNWVISTLPLTEFLKMLTPPPPHQVSAAAKKLRFRNLILTTFFLDRESISSNASIYFSDGNFPVSRVYEPKNRNAAMSPPGKTSLVAEIPCQTGGDFWRKSNDTIQKEVLEWMIRYRLIDPQDIIGSAVHRMEFAYPILEHGYKKILAPIRQYLSTFPNLILAGRSACFQYTHIHDLIAQAGAIIRGINSRETDSLQFRDEINPGIS